MSTQNQKGFTIIEVVLFLALSGAFLMIAFMGIQNRTANIQFTDSMRSLHNFLLSEQNKVRNGVNGSTTGPGDCDLHGSGLPTGTSGGCVLLGRVINFNAAADLSQISIDTLYATKLDTSALAASHSDIEKITSANPRKDSSTSNYEIKWGVEFYDYKSIDASIGQEIDKIGWMRSLESNRIIPIVFSSAITDIESVKFDNSDKLDQIASGAAVDSILCFRDPTEHKRRASIRLDNRSILTLTFDDANCD